MLSNHDIDIAFDRAYQALMACEPVPWDMVTETDTPHPITWKVFSVTDTNGFFVHYTTRDDLQEDMHHGLPSELLYIEVDNGTFCRVAQINRHWVFSSDRHEEYRNLPTSSYAPDIMDSMAWVVERHRYFRPWQPPAEDTVPTTEPLILIKLAR